MQLNVFNIVRKIFLVEKIFKMLLCLFQKSQETNTNFRIYATR